MPTSAPPAHHRAIYLNCERVFLAFSMWRQSPRFSIILLLWCGSGRIWIVWERVRERFAFCVRWKCVAWFIWWPVCMYFMEYINIRSTSITTTAHHIIIMWLLLLSGIPRKWERDRVVGVGALYKTIFEAAVSLNKSKIMMLKREWSNDPYVNG